MLAFFEDYREGFSVYFGRFFGVGYLFSRTVVKDLASVLDVFLGVGYR